MASASGLQTFATLPVATIRAKSIETSPTYIGLRVKRYGPLRTNTGASENGRTPTCRPCNNRSAQIITASPATVSAVAISTPAVENRGRAIASRGNCAATASSNARGGSTRRGVSASLVIRESFLQMGANGVQGVRSRAALLGIGEPTETTQYCAVLNPNLIPE